MCLTFVGRLLSPKQQQMDGRDNQHCFEPFLQLSFHHKQSFTLEGLHLELRKTLLPLALHTSQFLNQRCAVVLLLQFHPRPQMCHFHVSSGVLSTDICSCTWKRICYFKMKHERGLIKLLLQTPNSRLAPCIGWCSVSTLQSVCFGCQEPHPTSLQL